MKTIQVLIFFLMGFAKVYCQGPLINGQIIEKTPYQNGFEKEVETFAITYISDGLKVKGFLSKPKKKGKYPCIIWNRGGNRDSGKITRFQIQWIEALTKEGFVILASQYRGVDGGEGKEEFGGQDINDVLNLIPLAESLEEVLPEKIGMFGWSRGGMMTYLALTKTKKIKAAVVGGAPTDLFLNIKNRPEMETEVMGELIPNYYIKKDSVLKERSAIYFVDKFSQETPILIFHGNNDKRVNPNQSLSFSMKLNDFEIPHRLITFEGGDHVLTQHVEELDRQTIKWFKKYLN